MTKKNKAMDDIVCGAVVIGRNEGQRLAKCLKSLVDDINYIVYVDSGSTDDSLKIANTQGVETISLNMNIPFTAARARNEGATYILKNHADVKYIQFVDGDCEIQPGWVKNALTFLQENRSYAVACGRRRERFPEQSLFNQLCDIEWNTPIGDALACGGDALINMDAYQQVAGYRNDLIAGEEPEMCLRLRQLGWKIVRMDAEMTLHDAAMHKLSQWWQRTVRAGYAFTLGASIHGHLSERYWVKECQRIQFWGLILPMLIMISGFFFNAAFLGLFLSYPVQILRVALKRPELGRIKYLWAISIVLGKFPEMIGMVRFWLDKFTHSSVRIIEYK